MTRRLPGRAVVSRPRSARARTLLALVAMIAGLMVAGAPSAAAAVIEEEGQGPLDRIEVTPDLNCAVNHILDESGEFFGDTACGTLLAAGETLFGPATIPAGGGASPRTAYTVPEGNQVVSGSGTAADPFTIVTDVDLGTTGLHITQTDSYVNGQESYRTDVTVSNDGVDPVSAILYRAGDCFLQDSDFGFGSVDPSTGAVACVNGVIEGEQVVPGDRIIQWLPISAGSSFLEDGFDTVWSTIGSQQSFPNTCRCDEFIDNGAGLSWDLTVPASSSVTRSHLTTFSPEGTQPLTTTKTADSATAEAGSTDGYTITISNPNATPVPLDSIFDTLPSGFTYIPGSTTGMTTSDPTIDGQTLTWSEPGIVPAEDSAGLHFQVTVSSTPGTYTNSAGATAGSFSVAPTGPTAPITVTASEEEPEADLSIIKSDDAPFGPDPVSSGGTVAYLLSVSNAGPDDATEVSVLDTPEGGTIVSAAGTDPESDWSCVVASEGSSVTCDLAGSLGSGEPAEDLLVQVEAPETEFDDGIIDTATVSASESDPDLEDNSDTEATAVQGSSNPATQDHAQTFYDGTQEVTLETTRDIAGGFYSKLIIPAGLQPGVVTIDEYPADQPIPGFPGIDPATYCGGRPCVAQFQVTVLPGGQTPANDPIQVFWFYTDGTGGNKLYVKGDNEEFASEVKDCRTPGIAFPAKCRNSITRLPNKDREYVMLWRDGGDPVGAKRR
jgi:uncharacterized repeat protein (TIGR01451 family)